MIIISKLIHIILKRFNNFMIIMMIDIFLDILINKISILLLIILTKLYNLF